MFRTVSAPDDRARLLGSAPRGCWVAVASYPLVWRYNDDVHCCSMLVPAVNCLVLTCPRVMGWRRQRGIADRTRYRRYTLRHPTRVAFPDPPTSVPRLPLSALLLSTIFAFRPFGKKKEKKGSAKPRMALSHMNREQGYGPASSSDRPKKKATSESIPGSWTDPEKKICRLDKRRKHAEGPALRNRDQLLQLLATSSCRNTIGWHAQASFAHGPRR